MKKIIEDLGGVFDSNDENNKSDGRIRNKIDVSPKTFNIIPSDRKNTWTVYLQFDNDQPIPFAFVPDGDVMSITFYEPEINSQSGQSAILTFKDERTNKKLRLFAKK